MPETLINGYQMHYENYGEGATLLMIHGGLGGGVGSASIINHHSLPLGARYHVLFYDRRSAGLSEIPEDGYSLSNYCADVHALLGHLGISEAHILGSSAGGPIAMTFALEHPGMTKSLLLINTMSYCQEEQRQLRKQELNRVLSIIEKEEKSTFDSDQSIPSYQRDMSRYRAIAKTIQSYLDIGNSLEDRLGELAMPTLITHGDMDSRIPLECGLQLHSSIAQSEFFLIPDAGHGLLSNEPDTTRNLIVEFLEKVKSKSQENIRAN